MKRIQSGLHGGGVRSGMQILSLFLLILAPPLLCGAQAPGAAPGNTKPLPQWSAADWKAYGTSIGNDPAIKKLPPLDRAKYVADKVGQKYDAAGINPNNWYFGKGRQGFGDEAPGTCGDLTVNMEAALQGAGFQTGNVEVEQTGLGYYNPFNVNRNHGAPIVTVDGKEYVFDLWYHSGSEGKFSGFKDSSFAMPLDDWKALMKDEGYKISNYSPPPPAATTKDKPADPPAETEPPAGAGEKTGVDESAGQQPDPGATSPGAGDQPETGATGPGTDDSAGSSADADNSAGAPGDGEDAGGSGPEDTGTDGDVDGDGDSNGDQPEAGEPGEDADDEADADQSGAAGTGDGEVAGDQPDAGEPGVGDADDGEVDDGKDDNSGSGADKPDAGESESGGADGDDSDQADDNGNPASGQDADENDAGGQAVGSAAGPGNGSGAGSQPGDTTVGYAQNSSGRTTVTETRGADGSLIRITETDTDNDGNVTGQTTYEGGTGEGKYTPGGNLKGAEPAADGEVPPEAVSGGVNTSEGFAGNWTKGQTQRGTDGGMILAGNTQMGEAANVGNQTIADANTVRDGGGQDYQTTRDNTSRTVNKADQANSWGKALGDAVEQGITEGGKAFGSALGGAAADQAVGAIFGSPDSDDDADEGDAGGSGQVPTSGGTSAKGKDNPPPEDPAQGADDAPSGGDGGCNEPCDNGPSDGGGDGESTGGSSPPSSDPLGVTGSTDNDDGTVTIRYGCGYSWTGTPPGPSRCPICARETVSTETNPGTGGDGADNAGAGEDGPEGPAEEADEPPAGDPNIRDIIEYDE